MQNEVLMVEGMFVLASALMDDEVWMADGMLELDSMWMNGEVLRKYRILMDRGTLKEDVL
jgi:hypothetical protein